MSWSGQVLVMLAVVCLLGSLAALAEDGFTLRDYIGRTWRNEYVQFPLTEAQVQQVHAGHALTGPDGKAVPYQLEPGAKPTIAFLADLNAFETRAYQFTDAPANTTTDLSIEETADAITVTNHLTGVMVPKTLKGGAGPLAGVKMLSGKWVGASALTGAPPVTDYKAVITARGPVYAEVACTLTFKKAGTWTIRYRVEANEPVVLVDESLAVTSSTPSNFVLTLTRNFSAAHLFFRRCRQPDGTLPFGLLEMAALPVAKDGDPTFILEPWVHWNYRLRQGSWFGLYTDQDADMLSVGALHPERWVSADPERRKLEAPAQLILTQDDADLHLTFPLKQGERHWLLTVTDKAASLATRPELKKQVFAPLPQQAVIKHGNFPLNLVKDYVYSWPGEQGDYPRLIVTKADMAKFRASIADPTVYTKKFPDIMKRQITVLTLEEPLTAYFATADAQFGRWLCKQALSWTQQAIDQYFRQDTLFTFGTSPHAQQPTSIAQALTDVALGTGQLTPDERERLLAQQAFLGYTVSRPDQWDPARGFAANPGMTTINYNYRLTATCLMPEHPAARGWAKDALAEMNHEINTWSDEKGGWLESPHYAMVAYDQLISGFIKARNAGFGDYLYSDKMRKVIEWFAITATPPDSRIGGFRHKPPVGNTDLLEPTGEFGIVAYLWKDRDPAFSAEMQWMYHQNNDYPQPGIGGGYPSMAGYRNFFRDATLPAKAPNYGSVLFPETNAILRSGFPTDRETQLYLVCGHNHDHYDADSGTFTFWGKGRSLCDDFGYCPPGTSNHSAVDLPGDRSKAVLLPKAFATTPAVDFVQGAKDGWTRQILLLKDADLLKANYIVLNDDVTATPSTWRVWCNAKAVTPGAGKATVEGKEDVDMDVIIASPAGVTPITEDRTLVSSSGLYPDWTWHSMPSTQTGIILPVTQTGHVLAVLYPRLKNEAPPTVTTIANGNGAKIQHPTGTDYVFLGTKPFAYKEGDITFSGTVGAIELRGDKPALFLGAPGIITARGEKVTKEK